MTQGLGLKVCGLNVTCSDSPIMYLFSNDVTVDYMLCPHWQLFEELPCYHKINKLIKMFFHFQLFQRVRDLYDF